MRESLKYLADHSDISPECKARNLFINHPDAQPMRDRQFVRAALCYLQRKCDVERHDPPVHTLIFSLKGKGQVYTTETSRTGRQVKPGELVLLPAHHPHYYKLAEESWEGIWFYLKDDPYWSQLRNQKPQIRMSSTMRELHAAIEGFLAESLRNEQRARLAARHYAELIVLNLERELDVEESLSAQKLRQELYRLWDLVNSNLSRKWTVASLAQEVGISPQHLYRVNTHFCGYKPMEMVTRLRMQHAQELLISTDYSVKAIGERIGYNDPFSFSAAFKRFVGSSPRQYRNNHDHEAQKRIVFEPMIRPREARQETTSG